MPLRFFANKVTGLWTVCATLTVFNCNKQVFVKFEKNHNFEDHFVFSSVDLKSFKRRNFTQL